MRFFSICELKKTLRKIFLKKSKTHFCRVFFSAKKKFTRVLIRMIIDFDERNVENVCRKKMIGYFYFGYGRPAFCIPLVIPRLFLEPDKTIVVLFVGGPIGSEKGPRSRARIQFDQSSVTK